MRIKLIPGLALLLLAAGAWQFGSGVWIDFKAHLAQHLISQAWQRTLLRHAPVRPWPWADTWPVARLRWKHSVDLYVLAGINGASLPFGPGMEDKISNKTILIAGHRDTHFTFLARVRKGDRLTLTDMHGYRHVYRVTGRKVVDTRHTTLEADPETLALILVTCYPFHALHAGGPLRMVVTAVPVQTTGPGTGKGAPHKPTPVKAGSTGETPVTYPI